ncbi:RNA 2',3'-cyclic phosphodiesterase [Nocardioides perillae]|uniref:RNA 2',3'-cyclic phosphodiesterase n=1 Tax=Nocardioides perillae TaxID=1119534 RepID=A0A7Y9RQC8_9ACTN|nr:2'-5' RNA ligase [Nocardioides perillae]
MRVFVALRPPEEAVEHLADFLEPRREAAPPGLRWSLVEQLHVTLAFAAELEERRLDDLLEGVAAAAARRRPVPTRVAGGGAFPDVGRAKVLWAGLDLAPDDAAEVDALAAGVRTAVARAGAPVDGARFRPHLTVARLGRPREITRWVQLLDAYVGPRWHADQVAVVASHLGEGPGGRPRHEQLARLPVGA